MRTLRGLVLLVLGLLCGGVLLKGLAPGQNSDPTASTLNGAPRGLLALSMLLQRHDVEVSAVRGFAMPLPEAAVIVVPPPERAAFTDVESDELLARVQAGARLVILCDDEPERNRRVVVLLRKVGSACADQAAEPVTPAGGTLPAFAGQLDPSGTGRVEIEDSSAGIPAWRDDVGVLVSVHALGEGQVLVFGSATIFANDGLHRADHAAVALAWIAGRNVLVDERHHSSRGRAAALSAAALGFGPLTALVLVVLLVPLSLLQMVPRRGDAPPEDDVSGPPAAETRVAAFAGLLVASRNEHTAQKDPS